MFPYIFSQITIICIAQLLSIVCCSIHPCPPSFDLTVYMTTNLPSSHQDTPVLFYLGEDSVGAADFLND